MLSERKQQIVYKSAAVRGPGNDLVQMYQGLLLLLALYNSAFDGLLECRMSPYAADCPSHSPTGTQSTELICTTHTNFSYLFLAENLMFNIMISHYVRKINNNNSIQQQQKNSETKTNNIRQYVPLCSLFRGNQSLQLGSV